MGHGVGVRRTLHRRLAGLLLVAALVGAAGCTPETSSEPPEPFGDFAVGQFGGVAGLQEILRVRADGNAVLIAREPASGRLTAEEMGRLRTLLTSEQFRQEVARELEWKRKPRKIECSDQIITEVSMGSLSLSRSGPCGKEDLPVGPGVQRDPDHRRSGPAGRFRRSGGRQRAPAGSHPVGAPRPRAAGRVT